MAFPRHNPLGFDSNGSPVYIPKASFRTPEYDIDDYRGTLTKLSSARGLFGEFVNIINTALYVDEHDLINMWSKSFVQAMEVFSSEYHPRYTTIPISMEDIVFNDRATGSTAAIVPYGPAYFYIPKTGIMENNVILETLQVYGGIRSMYELNSVLSGLSSEFSRIVQKLTALLDPLPTELFTYEREGNRVKIDSGVLNMGYLSPTGNNGLYYVMLVKIMHEKDLSTVRTPIAMRRFRTIVFGTMAKNVILSYDARIGSGTLNIPNGTLEPSKEALEKMIDEYKELDEIIKTNHSKYTQMYATTLL